MSGLVYTIFKDFTLYMAHYLHSDKFLPQIDILMKLETFSGRVHGRYSFGNYALQHFIPGTCPKTVQTDLLLSTEQIY